jgi:AcrR family transcriptional regulator
VITSDAKLRGRLREAKRNDGVIFQAALRVLTRDPHASVSAVGREAGVGKSAIYSRYPSKETLLQRVAEEVTERYVALIDDAHEALDRGTSPGEALHDFLRHCVEADIHAFIAAASGRFTPTPEDVRLSRAGNDRGKALVARLQAAGALRLDATWTDLNDWLQGIAAIDSHQPERIMMRRRRMLSALMPGLAASEPALEGETAIATDYWPADVPGFADRPDVD